MLEEACKELDVKLAVMGNSAVGGTTYNQYISTLQQLTHLRDEHTALTEKATILKQLTTYLLVTLPSPQQSRTVQQLQEDYLHTQQQLTYKVQNIEVNKAYT